jgi:acetyl esterase
MRAMREVCCRPAVTTHLLTPAMRGLLDRIARARARPFHTLLPREARLAYAATAEVLDLPRAPLPVVRDVELPGGDGLPRPARLYAHREPGDGPPQPVLLYLHGGGFVIGGLQTHDSLCRQLALRSGGAVLALDYRLAPEHPFPAAVEDTWAALRALAGPRVGTGTGTAAGVGPGARTGAGAGGVAEALSLDPSRIAVGGDSAGGTLAAVAAILARDAGLPLTLQLLITPGTATGPAPWPSRHLFANGFLLDAVTVEWFFDHYMAGHPRHDWRFAPLEAPDLEGVAPACVVLAECDPLVDEGLAYADRLRMAGVPVALELVRGVTHDFIKMGRALKEAGAAQQAAADALRQAWGLRETER